MIAPDDNSIPADVLADMQAVADALASGELVAPEIVQRIHERSEKAQKELMRRYGAGARRRSYPQELGRRMKWRFGGVAE